MTRQTGLQHRLKLVEETRKRGGKGEAFGGAEGLFDDFTAEITDGNNIQFTLEGGDKQRRRQLQPLLHHQVPD